MVWFTLGAESCEILMVVKMIVEWLWFQIIKICWNKGINGIRILCELYEYDYSQGGMSC